MTAINWRLAGCAALLAIALGCSDAPPPTTPAPAPEPAAAPEPEPEPAPEPEPEVIVGDPVAWPVPCAEWPVRPCPSPLASWSVPSHDPGAPFCTSLWGLNIPSDEDIPILYGPQVALSVEESRDHNGVLPPVTIWFYLPFQPFNFSDRTADGSQRPGESVQRNEGDWVGSSAHYYHRVRDQSRNEIPLERYVGNVLDLDYGWPDEWGRPDLDFSTPLIVPFAVELRRTVIPDPRSGSGTRVADSRLEMPLLCAGAVPGVR